MGRSLVERFLLTTALLLLFQILFPVNSEGVRFASAQNATPMISSPELGNFIDIRVDNLPNETPAVAYNTQHNEFLVVWAEVVVPTRREIYGQRIGLDGSRRGNAIRIAFDSTRDCWLPAVSYSALQDKYLIVFTQEFSPTDFDVRSVLMTWDGGSISNVAIDIESTRKTWYPAVTYNQQNDEFLVIYENFKPDPQGREILAQRRKAGDGSQVGVTITIAGGTGEVRRLAKVAYNSTGMNIYWPTPLRRIRLPWSIRSE